MWTALVLLNLVALQCAVSSPPPSPINVIFSSVNLRNTLQWLPGNGTPDDAHFTVQYAIYGDSVEGSGRRVRWRPVRQCTEMVRSWCDLSNETRDLEQGYHARVRAVSRRASSKWALTQRRFDPKTDTTFGPPLMSVDIEDNTAIITLKGPMRHQPNNHTPGVSMATLYPQMTYNLSIHNTHSGQTSHVTVVSSPYKHRLMEYNTDYCFSAKTRFLSMPVKCQSSVWHCITTPADPVVEQLKIVVVGIVVTSVCVCTLVVIGYLLYRYLTGEGQKRPYILNLPLSPLRLLSTPHEHVNIFFFTTIQSDVESIVPAPAHPDPRNADPPPRYAPHRPETPEPEEAWDDSSVQYGFIGEAPEIGVGGGGEGRETTDDRGDGGNTEGSHPAGLYAPQAKTKLSQQSTHTCSQTHTQTQAQTEMSTLVQAHVCSQVNSVTQTQAQRAAKGEVDRKRENGGLFVNKTGLFHIPVSLQTKREIGMGTETGATEGKIDGGVKEGSESEEAPFLPAYAAQLIKPMQTSNADQSDLLPDDYGVLRPGTAQGIEEDTGEEEEEGTNCIEWDPETRKLVLPKMVMGVNSEVALDGCVQGEKGRLGGEKEVEDYMKRGELKLENVFVRQASEEEAEARREMERGGETDDLLSKWDLVISMDE